MAYDRFENRDQPRGWRGENRERNWRDHDRDERGFFERASDEVRSWLGDDEAERRRNQDYRSDEQDRGRYGAPRSRYNEGDDRSRFSERGGFGGGQRWRTDQDREQSYGGHRYSSGEGGGYGRSYGRQSFNRDEDRGYGRPQGRFARDEDDYRPMTGDYGRGGERNQRSGMGSQDYGRSQYGRQEFSQDQRGDRDSGRSYSVGGWGDRESRQQSREQSFGGGHHTDPHYSEWRQRQMSELDRDYDDYRREHQSKFENEFAGWRQTRQTKRQMLGQIREDMEVLGSDQQRIGTVDKVRGDKVILNRKDPEAGGVHRSFSCALLDKVEGDKVILSQPANEAKRQLRREDEHERSGGIMGGLFGRSDDRDRDSDRDDGPTDLNRSFSGTYER